MSDKYFRIGHMRALPENVEDTRTIEFVASDNSRDRHGTVLPVEKWDLTNYARNGLVTYMHTVFSSDPDNVIGKGVARAEGEQLIVAITFEAADLNPKADKIFRKYQAGTLNAVSVYFNPTTPEIGHWGEGDEARTGKKPTFYYDGQELLEVACVTLPSNTNANKRYAKEDIEALFTVFSEIMEKRSDPKSGNPAQQQDNDTDGRTPDENIRFIEIEAAAELALSDSNNQ